MTEQTTPTESRRAQIFALLRATELDVKEPVAPKYLDTATAEQMISRANTSFNAPPCIAHVDAPQLTPAQPSASQNRMPLTSLYNRAAEG